MGDRNLFPPEALKRNNGVNMCLLLGFSPSECTQAQQRSQYMLLGFSPSECAKAQQRSQYMLLGFSPGESAQARQRGDRQKEIERCY